MRGAGDIRQRLAAVLLLLLLLTSPALVWGASLEVRVTPDLVEIGAWFRGHRLTVSGMIPAGAEAVLEVVGQTRDEHLMRKGRRGGLWMNVGEIEIHQAPSLYMVMSSTPQLLEAPAAGAPWGFAALKRRLTLSGMVSDREKPEFFNQFLELKGSEGLYASYPGAVKKSQPVGELAPVTGEFRLPTNVRPGTYEVCLTAVQDGQVIAKQCSELQVKMVGFPALLSTLAYEHGATYGILAVVIAIVTGFVIGFLFKGGGGH